MFISLRQFFFYLQNQCLPYSHYFCMFSKFMVTGWRPMSGCSFVCIFYMSLSYLYSSIVEISCHFLFHGCGLLAEMPYTFVLFRNKCVKETIDLCSRFICRVSIAFGAVFAAYLFTNWKTVHIAFTYNSYS